MLTVVLAVEAVHLPLPNLALLFSFELTTLPTFLLESFCILFRDSAEDVLPREDVDLLDLLEPSSPGNRVNMVLIFIFV